MTTKNPVRSAILAVVACLSLTSCQQPASEPPLAQALSQKETVMDLPAALSRPKFPTEPANVVDVLELINVLVNTSMVYMSDEEQYGVPEKWVWLPESGKGDCEDFALAKLAMLQRAGYPIVSNTKVTFAKTQGGVGHAVLEVLLPNGSVAVLDNNFNTLMTREELVRVHGYVFFNW